MHLPFGAPPINAAAHLVQQLQMTVGLSWFGFILNNIACAFRWLHHKRRPWDAVLTGVTLLGIDQVAFVVRWTIFPGTIAMMSTASLISWAVNYAGSALATVFVIWTVSVESGEGRHKAAFWFQVIVLTGAVLIGALR